MTQKKKRTNASPVAWRGKRQTTRSVRISQVYALRKARRDSFCSRCEIEFQAQGDFARHGKLTWCNQCVKEESRGHLIIDAPVIETYDLTYVQEWI